MKYYLFFALLFCVLLAGLIYYSYRKERPVLVLVGGLVMLVILRVMTATYPNIWNTDEAEWISIAYRLPYCDIPYKCYDAHSTGYVNILFLQGLHYLGIEYSYTSLRLFGLFGFLVPSVLLFYFMVRKLYSARMVVLATGLLIHFFLFGAYNHDMLAYNSEYVIMFFTAVVFYCYTIYRQHRKTGALIVAALCLGLMPLAKLQSVAIVLGFGLLFLALVLQRKQWGHLAWLGSIGLMPLAMTFIAFRQMGIWDDFWKMYFESNLYLLKHYSGTTWLGKIKVFIYLQRWLVPYYILVLLMILGAYMAKKLDRSLLRKVDPAPVIILACAYFATAATGTGAEHYNTLIVIPLFLTIANILSLVSEGSWMAKGFGLLRHAALLICMGCLFMLLPEFDRFRKRISDDAYPYQAELVSYVQQQVPPGKPLCVLGWFKAVELQVDCQRPLATRTAHNFYLLADKQPDLMHYYQRQYISDLEESKPLLLIDPDDELYNELMTPVKEYVFTNYTPEKVINNYRVYKRKNL